MSNSELESNWLEQLIVDNHDLDRLEDLLAEFNIFDVLGVQTRETRHSAFLAWLLNSDGSHGLGEYFLRRFLSQVTAHARALGISAITAFDVDGWSLSDVVVETEHHNIDVLITSDEDNFVCVIENKLFSSEHGNQLTRYRNTVEKYYSDLDPVFVLLTIDGDFALHADDAANYVPVSYFQIADMIQRALDARGSNLGPDVRSALSQYVTTLRRHVLSDSEIQQLARSIYRNHKEAIDLIIEAKPDTQQEIRQIIELVVAEISDFEPDDSSKSLVRFYDPRWDDILQLTEGDGWTTSGRMFLIEFQNYPESLGMSLVLGPGPSVTRQKIFDAALANEDIFNPARKILPKSWAAVYRKPILHKRDYQNIDLEKVREKVKKVVFEFVNNHLDIVTKTIHSAL